VTRVDRRTCHERNHQPEAQGDLLDKLFDTQISVNTDLNKAQLAGMASSSTVGLGRGRDYTRLPTS